MNQKTGLVLEGGAMRGMFTAGALDVMMENGVTSDWRHGRFRRCRIRLQLQVPADRPLSPL